MKVLQYTAQNWGGKDGMESFQRVEYWKRKGYFIEGGVLTPLPTMIILCIQGCPIREYLAKAFSPFHVIWNIT